MTGRAGSVLRVDLDALAANIAHIRDTVAPSELMIVVKNDAYGHGLQAVVACAARQGLSWFGAFDAGTGAAVRALTGPGARIFVWLTRSADDIRVALDNALDIGIGDDALLDDVVAAARASGRRARVHLEVDSGLHRDGVRHEDWAAFVARAAAAEAAGVIDVAGVWSHLAEASVADDDAAHRIFVDAVVAAERAGLHLNVRHLAASAAGLSRPEFRHDLVRVGAFCYGIRPADGPSERDLGLTVTARWEATVTMVDNGAVTVGVGALDGLPSSLAGRVRVGTPSGPRRLRAVGETTSQISAWPGARVGDTVAVFGPGEAGEKSATDLAESIGTIGEEIAVRVAPTVPRVYRGAGVTG